MTERAQHLAGHTTHCRQEERALLPRYLLVEEDWIKLLYVIHVYTESISFNTYICQFLFTLYLAEFKH